MDDHGGYHDGSRHTPDLNHPKGMALNPMSWMERQQQNTGKRKCDSKLKEQEKVLRDNDIVQKGKKGIENNAEPYTYTCPLMQQYTNLLLVFPLISSASPVSPHIGAPE
jgi:hypothetical protein